MIRYGTLFYMHFMDAVYDVQTNKHCWVNIIQVEHRQTGMSCKTFEILMDQN